MKKRFVMMSIALITANSIVLLQSCSKNSDTNNPIVPPAEGGPRINSFTPQSAARDSVVVINGINFSDRVSENIVLFNNIPATVISATPTRIEVKVPKGAGDGKIIVQVGNRSTPSANNFTYLFTVSTLAGGRFGFEDGAAADAKFSTAFGLTADAFGNIIVADGGNNRIRKIDPAGQVTTVAGSGIIGFNNGQAAEARFNFPRGVATDAAGNIYVADAGNNRIRKITPAGVVTTLAGDGTQGFADGPAAAARFNFPVELVVDDATGNIFVTDGGNHRVRKITPGGVVSTVGGAVFNFPEGIAMDALGNFYIADPEANKIFKMTQNGIVTTVAGSDQGFKDGAGAIALFSFPEGIAVDRAGNIYVGDLGNEAVRKITTTGIVFTIAGGTPGFEEGVGTTARFSELSGVTVNNQGDIFVSDVANSRIRMIK